MWTADTAVLDRAVRYRLCESGAAMSWRQVIDRWADAAFADWFGALLAGSSWPAFFWECPPVTAAALDARYEFVLTRSDGLARARPDPAPFSGQFRAGELAVGFPNLGRDAFLVAPCPGPATPHSAHLAAFVRGAGAAANRALWLEVSMAARAELDERPLWISTSGLGVYWVHVRLDRRPKYYTHAPYR